MTSLRPTIHHTLRAASRHTVLAGALALCGLAANAQSLPDNDWKESDVPPPPAFNQDKLVAIEMPRYMSLKFGIDPSTITLTNDGVVRYVVVAANHESGGFNAFYEGVRCTTGEYRTYARFTSNGKWEAMGNSDWRHIVTSSYTSALATQALCRDNIPRANVSEMINNLKDPAREFTN